MIFDMDGVLVDTEGYYARRRKEFLLAEGVPYEDSWDFTGLNKQATWAKMVPDAARRQRLMEEYDRDYSPRHPIPFARLSNPDVPQLFRMLKARGIKTGIASSSPADSITKMAEALGIGTYIDVAVSGEECPAHKPDPAVYLQALKGLELSPAQALAVEDSPAGIQAAKRAGIYTLALSAYSGAADQSAADAKITRLTEVLGYLETKPSEKRRGHSG
ncbi:HAD family hydrolase [Acutalibacter muris]|uniref:HAD family hydrolase n=1 Tax=Acutalibacter muris TaxID=1796620 RepID=UPI001C3F0C9D|nr:HAD family phosphatase [Acutalibacter muris]